MGTVTRTLPNCSEGSHFCTRTSLYSTDALLSNTSPRMPLSALSEQQQAFISSRARVWEVRRFCQVLPSVAQYVRGADSHLISSSSSSTPLRPHQRFSANEPDGALAALLRCLVHRTGADLAMVSLLDDHTQYFVSGASRTNMHDVKVTLGECGRPEGCSREKTRYL